MGAKRYRIDREEIAAEVISGEAVILNLSTGVYHNADGSGGFAWALLAGGYSTAEVADRLAAEYGIVPAEALADVERLCVELEEHGLVEALPDGSGAAPSEPEPHELPASFGLYSRPILETHSEMGDLLALDPPMPGIKQVPWQAAGD